MSRFRIILGILAGLAWTAASLAQAAPPRATPYSESDAGTFTAAARATHASPRGAVGLAAFSDPVLAAKAAGLRLVDLQSDVTEDNAGNGNPDVPADGNDGGWDWNIGVGQLHHVTAKSYENLYGPIARGLVDIAIMTNDARMATAVNDVFAGISKAGTGQLGRYYYRIYDGDIASAYVDWANHTGNAALKDTIKARHDTELFVANGAGGRSRTVRNGRGAGLAGLWPWDIHLLSNDCVALAGAFPGSALAYMTEVDSISQAIMDDMNGLLGATHKWDPTNFSQNYHQLGIAGALRVFDASPRVDDNALATAMRDTLVNGQLPDGSWGVSYGGTFYAGDAQTTAYAVRALMEYSERHSDGAARNAANLGNQWLLGLVQASGIVDDGGGEYSELNAEVVQALLTGDPVGPVAPTVCISSTYPCVQVPVVFDRIDPTDVRGYTVTLTLSANLSLCGGGIVEGSYLNSVSGTHYEVLDNGGGSYTVDCAILGLPCGATGTGTLFTLNLASAAASGTGTVTINSVAVRDCDNAPVGAIPGAPIDITIDNTTPVAVSGLAATQVKTGNDASGTTKIDLAFSGPGDAAALSLWRAPFGNYPEYDDAPNAGSVPALPVGYPPPGWSLVASVPGGTTTYSDFVPNVESSIRFETPTYSVGNINGQDGWSKTGSYDVAVVSNTYGYGSFQGQSLRISNAITSGSFGDMAFAKPLVNSVGEADATAGSFSVGVLGTQFNVEFDLASVQATQQPGMFFSMSPDRGDGSRMSYLNFTDDVNGIDVVFYDVQGTSNPANFVDTQVADDLDRTRPHHIRLAMTMLDGPSNDIVKVYIDGALVHTGTSWENYYRYDSEAAGEQSPRIMKTAIFRTSGPAVAANAGKGFLIDNLTLSSAPEKGMRDFWYYVAYALDGCGNVSAVSNKTGGTLNYHLGDVTDGVTPGQGNNLVNTADITKLGLHYGISLGAPDALGYLDVGPTTDYSVNARPTTDNKVQFEDLMMFAINYGQVAGPQMAGQPATRATAASRNAVSLAVPELPAVGETFAVGVTLEGAGDIQGLSLKLGWNGAVVEPVGVESGALLAQQAGPAMALSSEPGDVDMAVFGTGAALVGTGEAARVTFRVKAEGDAAIELRAADARGTDNRVIALGSSPVAVTDAAPERTALQFAAPNPFSGSTTLSFSLARGGPAELGIYSVDGRRVKTLTSGERKAGVYRLAWNGTDDRGHAVQPGLYFARLVTVDGRFSRTVILVR